MNVLRRWRSILLSLNAGLLLLLVLIGTGAYLFVFRAQYYASEELGRSAVSNAWLDRGFSVAVVWRRSDPNALSLREGLQLALDEINARGGRLAGKVNLLFYDETGDSGEIARTVVARKDVIAVIGHEADETTIPASVTYNSHGVLFLSPKSTDIRLTGHQFPYVFRLSPDDSDMTTALQRYAVSNGWRRVGILHARTEHGEAASNRFLTAAGSAGITVPFMRSYFHVTRPSDYRGHDFRQMLAEIRDYQVDALALAGELPWAGKLIRDIQQMQVRLPVLATDKLDSSRVEADSDYTVGSDLRVASAVDPDSNDDDFAAFRNRFRAKFGGRNPGYGSSQGYGALMLLASAIQYSGSADPVVVATTLKVNCWNSVFGEVGFDAKGDIIGRHISIKQWTWKDAEKRWGFETVQTMAVADDEIVIAQRKALMTKEGRTCLP